MNNFGKKTVLDDMREYLRKWNITEDALAQKVADTTIDVIEKACKDRKEPIRVFLSLPMSGRSTAAIVGDLSKMKTQILLHHAFGDEEIIFEDNFSTEGKYPWGVVTPNLINLGDAIKKMAYCNAVVFHPEWKIANGCGVEYEVCLRYGIPGYEMSEYTGEITPIAFGMDIIKR